MVLLVEHIPVPWRPHEVVHAVPNLSLVGEVVATLPGDAPIFGSEHTGRRDPEPHLLGISRVSDDRMQHQPGSTRAPLRGGRVVGERVDNLPGDSVIIAGEQRRGLGSRIQPVPHPGQRPDLGEPVAERRHVRRPADHLGEVGIGCGPLVDLTGRELRQRPRMPGVLRAPHPGTGPAAPATGPEPPGHRIPDDMVDRPAVAVWSANGPREAIGGAVEDEGTLRGADQQTGSRTGHRRFSIQAGVLIRMTG